MYYQNLIIFIAVTALILVLYWSFRKLYKIWELHKLNSQPFPKRYEDILNAIPYYQKLNTQDRAKIKKSILLFIESKEFTGIRLTIGDEIKVTVAFYACILLLRITSDNCYDNLSTIIVYPNSVLHEATRVNAGIVTKEQIILAGQSANDTVVISWSEAEKEAYHASKENVILHEFTHEIDFLDGEIDGIPPLSGAKYAQWSKILYQEYNRLKVKAIANRYWGKYKILGDYAATNEAEFFAVATERFFGTPNALKHHFPDLYKELKNFYKIDPAKEFAGG